VILSRFAEETRAAETACELNKCLYSTDPEVGIEFKLETVNPIPKSTMVLLNDCEVTTLIMKYSQ
jgi:hypothetical protein